MTIIGTPRRFGASMFDLMRRDVDDRLREYERFREEYERFRERAEERRLLEEEWPWPDRILWKPLDLGERKERRVLQIAVPAASLTEFDHWCRHEAPDLPGTTYVRVHNLEVTRGIKWAGVEYIEGGLLPDDFTRILEEIHRNMLPEEEL